MNAKKPKQINRKARKIWGNVGLILLCLITLYPLIFSFLSSFKGTFEIYSSSFALPESWALTNYNIAIFQAGILKYVRNSLVIAVGSVVLLLIVSSMASYALARMEFKLNPWIYMFFIAGVTVPIHSTIIPIYKSFANLNLLDSYFPLFLLYVAFHSARSILIITGHMRGISKEIEESAIIDGCNTFQIFTRMIVPLSKPGIATAGTIAFLYTYNDLLFPMLFITSKSKQSISQGLMSFQGEFSMELGPIFAAIIVCVLPMMLMFFAFQKQVINGIAAGSVKG